MISEDYREQLVQDLTPPGDALPREPGSLYSRLMHVLADEFARYDAFVRSLADELDPRATSALLPEWEAMTGLPDPCMGQLPSIAARRNAVVQRLTARHRLDKQAIIEAAEAFGFTITAIVEHDAHVIGGEIGEELAHQESQFVVDIETPDAQVFDAEIGAHAIGEPLGWIGDAALACLLDRIKPAHIVLRIVQGA